MMDNKDKEAECSAWLTHNRLLSLARHTHSLARACPCTTQAGHIDDDDVAAEVAELQAGLDAAPVYEVAATGARFTLENAQVGQGGWGRGRVGRRRLLRSCRPDTPSPAVPASPNSKPPPAASPCCLQLLLSTYMAHLPCDQYTQGTLRPLYRTGQRSALRWHAGHAHARMAVQLRAQQP